MTKSLTARRLRWTLLATSCGCLLASPALAQEKAAETGGLEEIIVTARKKEENLQNIPVAATVMQPTVLNNFQVNNIEKITTLAPQLIVGRSGTGNGASIGLRGISVNATSISLEQSVAVIIDGVYFSGGRALNEGLFDLERVEVLKGPQSLFYGKNTTAGAISFTSAEPTHTFKAMLRSSYEFKAHQPMAEGFVSGPLTDNLSVRLAGRWSDQSGALIKNRAEGGTIYTKDVATGIATPHTFTAGPANIPGENAAAARLTLKYEPTSQFTVKLKANYNKVKQNTPAANTVIGFCEKGFVQSDPAAPCGTWASVQQNIPADIAATNPILGRHGGAPYLDYKSYNFTGTIDYTGDKVSISVIPAYAKWETFWRADNDYTNAYPAAGAFGKTGGNGTGEHSSLGAFSIEARARTSFDGPLNAMVGGYFQDSTLKFQQDNVFPGGQENSAVTDPTLRYLTLRKVSHTFGKTYALFGQLLFDVTPTLNLTGGARYSWETKSSIFAQPYVNPLVKYDPVAKTGTYRQDQIGADQKFSNFSPEVMLTWKPQPNLTIYGGYKTGYKSGGFSISGLITKNTTAADAAFNPEKAAGFEGGIKTTLMDNQLRLNLDLYNYTYKNMQVDFFDATLVQYLTLNAAKVRTRGAELQAEFAPRAVDGLVLRSSIAYNDAVYTSFPFAPCLGGQTPAEGCLTGATPQGVRTYQNLDGQRPQQAPKWTGTIGVDYNKPIGSDLKVGFSGNVRYSSSYRTNPFVNDSATRFVQGSFATIDANLRLAQQDDRWEIALIGKNLTNKFITAVAFDLTYTGGGTGTAAGVHPDGRSSVYDPRTVAIQGTVRF